MEIKYTCSVCGQIFDDKEACETHETGCNKLKAAESYGLKLAVLGMRACSEVRCGTCRYFKSDLAYSNYGGICQNPTVRDGMDGLPMPWYDAMSVCNFYEMKDNNNTKED